MKSHRVYRDMLRHLDTVFATGSHVVVLRYLCRTGGAHTGRAIGRAIGLSHHVVHRALSPLAALGMLDAERQGRSIVYRLNEHHWLVRDGLRPLYAAEAGLHPLLGEAVRQAAGVPVRAVILFGSEGRGEARADSDVDIACLTHGRKASAAAEDNLTKAAASLRRQFGRRLSVLVWDAREFARRYQARDRLAREIADTGWTIAGAALGELIC
jgi:predicted nucleotidyltransferase/DNA-binding transcriptional ArsR family regulator